MTKPLPEIENPENLRLHRLGWAAQKLFRWVLAAFVLAGALGIFGTGALSRREQRFGTRLVVRSERMARVSAVTRMTILCLAGQGEPLSVTLPHGILERYAMENVWPEPLAQTSVAEGIRYEFARRAGVQIALTFRPQKFGWSKDAIMIGRDAVDFSQIVYP